MATSKPADAGQIITIESLAWRAGVSKDALADLYLCDYFNPDDEDPWLQDLTVEEADDLIARLGRTISGTTDWIHGEWEEGVV